VKKLIVLALVAIVAYAVYRQSEIRDGAYTAEITNPIYVEIRMRVKAPGRDIDTAIFGKMASTEDCELRSERVWKKVVKDCPTCEFTAMKCRNDLEQRYLRLFDNTPIHSTYLSFDRGSRYERDGRMVVYGLTSDEGDKICEMLKKTMQQGYTGKVTCILASPQ